MIVRQLIDHSLSPLTPNDTGNHAIMLMEEHHLKQLPLVEDGKYLSLIKEEALLEWLSPDLPLLEGGFLQYQPALAADAHPFEALRLMNSQQLTTLPIVDHENNYLGVLTQQQLIQYCAEKSGINNLGGIIVVEVAPRDYNLAEITRICENEEVSILTMFVNTVVDGRIEITLKTNRANITALSNAFERYGIQVKEVYTELQDHDDIKDRYNLLMNYINM